MKKLSRVRKAWIRFDNRKNITCECCRSDLKLWKRGPRRRFTPKAASRRGMHRRRRIKQLAHLTDYKGPTTFRHWKDIYKLAQEQGFSK